MLKPSSLAVVLLLLSSGIARADDPLKVAAGVYKLNLDNERVRVFDVHFKPGEKAKMHSHPDHVVHVLNDGRIKVTMPDGKSQTLDLKAGQTLFLAAGDHAAENVGKTDLHNLVVELKPAK